MIELTLLSEQKSELKHWIFQNKTVIKIGRDPNNDVVVKDNLVSRHHLELRQKNNGGFTTWELLNHGTNGTFLNDVEVSQDLVFDGALIQLAKGGPVLKFQTSTVVSTTPVSPAIASSCTHEGNNPENLFCIHCGQPLKVQQVINQYQVLRTLGAGGMGTTYLACNPEQVARSRLPPGTSLLVLKEMNADMAQIEKARELFAREVDTLKKLNHPGIPQFVDSFIENDKKYLAMELIHGQDLEKLVFQQGPCTPDRAIEWMIQTCEVLEYLHNQDPPIVHRDIKPANLLRRHLDNRIFVIDFGAVKEIGTFQGTRIGADGYSAPEQNLGKPVIESDLYAIGPTLIFLLTSENPQKFYRRPSKNPQKFYGRLKKNQPDRYRFQVEDVPTITPQLRSVIEKVTEHKPEDRFSSARELIQALRNCYSRSQ